MGERRGRPKELNSKSKFHGVRVSMEDDFHFRKVCEKEGYSSSEGLRMAMKALQYIMDRIIHLDKLINQAVEEG